MRTINREDLRGVPQAASFDLWSCGTPGCGMHLIANDRNDKPICEVVISREGMLRLVKTFQDFLYQKAVEDEE